MIQLFETFLHQIVEIAILTFEFIGVGIIIYSGLQGFFLYLKRSPATKLTLAKGLAMGPVSYTHLTLSTTSRV